MAWDPTPWFVQGGAHSAQVARLIAYAALGGQEGVIANGDCKVVPLATPGAGVQVSTGGIGILDRGTDGAQQEYVGRLPASDTVTIAQTGSSGGRSDLIIARVEDPNDTSQSWQTPADPTAGPYIFTRVISNVSSTAKSIADVPTIAGQSAVALARVDIPANTATITAGMITDLRQIAQPRSKRVLATGSLTGKVQTLTAGQWNPYPANPLTGIQVPSWASKAVLRMETTINYISGNVAGNYQSFLGPAGQLDSTTLWQDLYLDATTGGGQYRQPLVLPSDGEWSIPKALRGTTVQMTSRLKGAASGGKLAEGTSDYYLADITFLEVAE